MNKYIITLIALIISLFAMNASAFTPPDAHGYVMDMAGKLSQDQVAQLNNKLNAINHSTKNEYAALIVPSMDGDSIEQVAQATFDKWKVGKAGLDNGVLVVIAVAERKSRIQTGSGVGGDLPDILCNDILRQNLNPHLKQGDFFGGLSATFDAINSHIESRHNATTTPAANTTAKSSDGDGAFMLAILLIFLAVVGIALIVNFFQKKNEEKERLRRAELYNFTPGNHYQHTYNQQNTHHLSTSDVVVAGAVAGGLGLGAGVAVAASLEAARHEEERKARKRREQEEENSRSSYSSSSSSDSSSSSSYDYSGGSSSGGSDYSGGGGDSGGGGSSSDW